MNELEIFQNEQFGQIRTMVIDSEPWFVGKDVADALGYANTKDALARHVDDEDKLQGDGVVIHDPMGREQHPTIINESGLYSLVLSSKLPEAKAFKRWITHEVIPAIRKHGAYMTGETLEAAMCNPDFLLKLATQLKAETDKRKELEAQAEKDKPKVLFADCVTTAKTSILVGELAKLLRQNGIDMGQNRLYEWLRQNGYLIRRKGTDYNMPTQRAMELGLFEIKETSITHSDGHSTVNKTPKVTGKGQVYFINLFVKAAAKAVED